ERVGDRGQLLRRFLGQRAERVQGPVTLPPRQQRTVVEGEERPAQGREQRQLVLRALDREKHVAERLDLLADVDRAAANEDGAPVAAPEGATGALGAALFPRSLAAEQQADGPALERSACIRAARLRPPPAAARDQPLDEGGNRVRERALDLVVGDPAEVRERLRDGERDHGGAVPPRGGGPGGGGGARAGWRPCPPH